MSATVLAKILSERVTINELARTLGVHSATCWRWCTRGIAGRKLPRTRVGGRVFIAKSDLEEFLRATNGAAA